MHVNHFKIMCGNYESEKSSTVVLQVKQISHMKYK